MPPRPNIVFILTDDQGAWANGCYGNSEIRTPNIDRLAAGGLRFENFFCSTPVCSPSRANFLTGKIASAHGVHDWIREGNHGDDAATYLEGQTAYTDVLARSGYTCGISGKWHLGNSQLPQHGFSHWFVHERGGGPYLDAPMIRDGELINVPGYITTAITDDAIEFIETCVAAGRPFYSSIHYTAPHKPWLDHPADIVALYDDCPFESCPQEPRHPDAGGLTDACLGDRELLQGYFAATTAMDADIGRLLDRLDELAIRDDTLVIFTSDNGFNLGHHGFWGKGNGTYPPNMYETSIRVPFIVNQPGVIPSGPVVDGLFSNYDFMPTLLDHLGLDVPDGDTLPGRSFAPALRGEPDPGRDHVVIYDEYGATRMIRDRLFKYVHRHADGPHEFYDLAADPDERQNRIDDPDRQPIITAMQANLDAWFERYVDPDLDGRFLDVRGMGQLRPVLPDRPAPAFQRTPGDVPPSGRHDNF
jgi:choline-sulfatase